MFAVRMRKGHSRRELSSTCIEPSDVRMGSVAERSVTDAGQACIGRCARMEDLPPDHQWACQGASDDEAHVARSRETTEEEPAAAVPGDVRLRGSHTAYSWHRKQP